ncbi:MAG: endo alpha-1,4 polygalactosaminidase [Chloroflexota bacterium]|nr:endo alpha-1,4 polygalactosaminidase [Chloroflexota bacterium]
MSKKRMLIALSGLVATAAVAVATFAWNPDSPTAPSKSTFSYTLEDSDNQTAAGAVGTPITFTEPISIYLPLVEHTSPDWWQPPVGTSWQWQLTDLPLDQSFDVDMYDIEMFDHETSTVAELHAQGRTVICYISVGSWEDWRSDADQFPASVIGNDYEGWSGEKWLDIRQIDLLAPIMRARLDQCQAKGFDGVEPDNIDGYINDTGFPLTYQDQLNYNIWLANEAHARSLSIGLKNDGAQTEDLLSYFDWALTEDCFAEDWCTEMEPFIAAGKAVFAAEYTDQLTINQFLNQVCPQAEIMNFDAILKNRDLDAWRQDCP